MHACTTALRGSVLASRHPRLVKSKKRMSARGVGGGMTPAKSAQQPALTADTFLCRAEDPREWRRWTDQWWKKRGSGRV